MKTVYDYAMDALQGAETLSSNADFNFAGTAFPRMVADNQNNPDSLKQLFEAASEFAYSNPNSVVTNELKVMYPGKI